MAGLAGQGQVVLLPTLPPDAGLLARKQHELVGASKRAYGCQSRQKVPMGSEGPLGYRDSSHVLYSRVIEQSVLKTLGRRAGIQVSPTGRYMSTML